MDELERGIFDDDFRFSLADQEAADQVSLDGFHAVSWEALGDGFGGFDDLFEQLLLGVLGGDMAEVGAEFAPGYAGGDVARAALRDVLKNVAAALCVAGHR